MTTKKAVSKKASTRGGLDQARAGKPSGKAAASKKKKVTRGSS